MRRFSRAKIFGFILLAALGVIAFSGVVMLLWNALVPGIFHLPVITYWQALGLLILTRLLFGGFRGGGGFGHRGRWKDRLRERWMTMSPEDRERLRQEWGRRCGRSFPFEEKPFEPAAPQDPKQA
jgi:hypothetical protein